MKTLMNYCYVHVMFYAQRGPILCKMTTCMNIIHHHYGSGFEEEKPKLTWADLLLTKVGSTTFTLTMFW